MPHVFISYKNKPDDIKYRDELLNYLSNIGYTFDNGKLWYDRRGLDLGDEWFSEIRTALDEAFAVIVVITKNSIGAAWVNFELAYATSQGIPIVGIMFSKANIKIYPISHFQIKKWEEVQKMLPEILQKYNGEFSLSKLSALAIWKLFEPLMFYVRFFLWVYYQINKSMGDLTNQYLFDIHTFILDEILRLETEMITFWLEHSHAFTRRQKKYFTRFGSIGSEILEQIAEIIASSPETEVEAVEKLERLLGELYTTEADPKDLTNYSYIAVYFTLENDIYFKKFPQNIWIKNLYPFVRKESLEGLALSDNRNLIGRILQRIIPDNVFQQINETVEWVHNLNSSIE